MVVAVAMSSVKAVASPQGAKEPAAAALAASYIP